MTTLTTAGDARKGTLTVFATQIGQALRVGTDIAISVLAINQSFALLGISAPADMPVLRIAPKHPPRALQRTPKSGNHR